MQVTEPEDAQRHAVLYRATIDHAVRGAPDLMARLVVHVRASLRDLESRSHDRRERERLTFGIEPQEVSPHSVEGALVQPVRSALATLAPKGGRGEAGPQPATPTTSG